MKVTTYLLITSLARFPSIITSTIGGNALWMQNYRTAIWVFTITLAVSLIGIIDLSYDWQENERQQKRGGKKR
jgi:uncharacterized membrane protein YdjX (TVP38/TMEM64 family)